MKKRIMVVLLAAFFLSGCTERSAEVTSFTLNTESPISSNKLQEIVNEDVSEENTEAGASESISENKPEEILEEEPVKVKGIYVTGPMAGNSKMQDLIQLVDDTELNTMVIDIKNDEGVITYKMQSDTVIEINASKSYIKDMELLMQQLKEKNIYTIARIVVFKDPILAAAKPELSIKAKSGQTFYDKQGLAWVNPYEKKVWEYMMEVATQAAQIGFDEIQFDYIRFSTDVSMSQADFGEAGILKSKEQIITEFAEYAYQTLHPLGVAVSADVFGTAMDNKEDGEIIGQNYIELAKHLDIICPMVYPSHYGKGVYGIEVPDAEPYQIILKAMEASKTALAGGISANAAAGRQARVRPWLQDFTASWVPGHISYGAEQIKAQIQAVYDAGYEEWILWNAANHYTKEGLIIEGV